MQKQIAKILLLCINLFGLSCNSFAQKIPKLKSKVLNEVSGLVCSGNKIIYVHNDSGDNARFFAINSKGDLLATLNFKGDPAIMPHGVADCEDIAMGPGPVLNKSYIYLGDIGDNGAKRRIISVYRFAEPVKPQGNISVQSAVLHLRYPNGPQDAETIMVDPILKELIIVSKRQDTVGIYTTPLAFKNGDTVTLKKVGALFIAGTAPKKFVVAGDISRDGKQVLLKTYEKVYYWKRSGNEPLRKTLQRKAVELQYIKEPQGETIGFTADGKGYYCISEGKKAKIYYKDIPKSLNP